MGFHIIQFPTGRFGFVGKVPAELAYTNQDGSPASAEFITSQLRLPANARSIKGKSWESFEAAENAAKSLGYQVVK